MRHESLLGKINEINSSSSSYISKRLKEENFPLLRNHLPLFFILPHNGEMMQFNEIASNWNISKSSLSDVLAKYEELGFIKKSQCDSDKRITNIGLTQEAYPILDKLKKIGTDLINILLSDFETEDREIFETYINKVISNIDKAL
ncbi:MarR family winged helix-turn-helix transcriptional regulator [Chengkuizengella axinellae]|uniref:MarR family transcriptional regulator n=1 Tax=Chengkuizengella axinellae TaxID=3064388 RepID=A0ABT9J521_9BACL|nr:MarR family transcriptional regulator [Chengkuizengella sp. 2205SS18-9]MDP5276044.1 MarR family transcriptional regulator [Chengkuizengella sp. 2205SS18-9]